MNFNDLQLQLLYLHAKDCGARCKLLSLQQGSVSRCCTVLCQETNDSTEDIFFVQKNPRFSHLVNRFRKISGNQTEVLSSVTVHYDLNYPLNTASIMYSCMPAFLLTFEMLTPPCYLGSINLNLLHAILLNIYINIYLYIKMLPRFFYFLLQPHFFSMLYLFEHLFIKKGALHCTVYLTQMISHIAQLPSAVLQQVDFVEETKPILKQM